MDATTPVDPSIALMWLAIIGAMVVAGYVSMLGMFRTEERAEKNTPPGELLQDSPDGVPRDTSYWRGMPDKVITRAELHKDLFQSWQQDFERAEEDASRRSNSQ